MRRAFGISVLGFFLYAGIALPAEIPAQAEPYIEIELKRIEETYALLDHYAEKIWPGWNDYLDIEYNVQFPNLVLLLVQPRKKLPDGFEPMPGRIVHGKPVYINRHDELPFQIHPPLLGGGQGGLRVSMELREAMKKPSGSNTESVGAAQDAVQKDQEIAATEIMSEGMILMNIHEFFHGFQQKTLRDYKKTLDENDEDIQISTEYAAYSEIEGLALLSAYKEKDDGKAIHYLKDYIVARQIKHTHMDPKGILAEANLAAAEGIATYANVKMAILLNEGGYKPVMTKKDDPFFFNYKFMNDYIRMHVNEEMEFLPGKTLESIGKGYTYGLIESLLLDRFVPGWKNDFFIKQTNLDDVLAGFLKIGDQEKIAIVKKFASAYRFNELFKKHQAVIKKRDGAVALIQARKGKKFIVDFSPTKEMVRLMPRNDSMWVGVQQIFPNGFKTLTMNEIEITSVDTPLCKPNPRLVEWIDTETNKGEKGYELTYMRRDGEIFKNAQMTTKGFSLKAPELQIREDDAKNQVEIIVLCKVARDKK